jgi:hypothetical protein
MKTKQPVSANASGAQASPPTAAENAESLVVTRDRALQASAVQPSAAKGVPSAGATAAARLEALAGAPARAQAAGGAPAVATPLPAPAVTAAHAGAPVLAADARGNWPSAEQAAGAPGVSPRDTRAGSSAEGVWEPLRSVEDINEIHVAGAALIAVLMFAIGILVGRRRRRVLPIAQSDQPEPQAEPSAELALPPSEVVADSTPIEPPLSAAQPVPAAAVLSEEWSFDEHTQPPAAPGNLVAGAAAVLAQVEVPAAAAANDTNEAAPAVREAPLRREGAPGSAYTTRGGVQEELVVRRRPDRRGD